MVLIGLLCYSHLTLSIIVALQVYVLIGHVIYVFLGGYLCAMFVQFPLSKGLERAVTCSSKVEALAAGSHSDEDNAAVAAWRKRQQAGILTPDKTQ